MSSSATGSVPAIEDLTSLVGELGRAGTVVEAAELLVKHVLHHTGAQWAEVVEPRGPGTAVILASTDVTLSERLLACQQLGPGVIPPLPAPEPVSQTLVMDDVRTDPRWPAFATYAAETLPVRAAVLQYITVTGRYAAGLAVYDDRPGFFTPEHVQATRLLASIAGLALAGLADADRAGQLGTALASNRTIGTAVGILMNRERLTQPVAFARLVTVSRRSNRKLRDVAADVVENGRLPPTPG